MGADPRFFETLGVRYTGPFDGHDIPALEEALRNASQIAGPQVVHVLTQKGRGYGPAENDPIKHLHDIGAPKPGSYTAAFTEVLIKEAVEHPEIVAITAAMPDSTGLLPFAEQFPDRCIDVGIAEQHTATAAAGMAMGGLRPVVAVYSTFLTRAFDQVNLDVGLHHQPVIFCLDRAGITGDDGPSHHGVLDMVLLTKVPGMTVFAPSSYQELQQMFHDAVGITDGPVSIRWPKTAARQDPPRRRRLGATRPAPAFRRRSLHHLGRQDAGCRRTGRRPAHQRRRVGHALGCPRGQAPRSRDAGRRRPPSVRADGRGRDP